MDSLSQIVLGASVAEASIGGKVGNKAMFWGAVAGTIPDLDVFSKYVVDTVGSLWFHRTVTHSLIFCIVFAPILGWIIHKIHKNGSATWKDWCLMSFWCLVTHPLLDCFTTWGTMFFWPFSEFKIAWKTVFVVDPMYTIPFLVLVVWAMFYNRTHYKRSKFNNWGLGISSFYLFLTIFSKQAADANFNKGFESAGITPVQYDTRPTPLNNILWTTNAEIENEYLIGYYSHFDTSHNSDFQFFNKNHHLLETYSENKKLQTLIELTQGYYTVEQIDSVTYHISDLRFGQVYSHTNKEGFFVFTYVIDTSTFKDTGELTITQKPNEFKGAGTFISELWNRILGQ